MTKFRQKSRTKERSADSPPRSKQRRRGRERSPAENRPDDGYIAKLIKETREFLEANIGNSQEQKPANGLLGLDPWQEDAYNALLARENVIVDAPTTAGKTRVVETFFRTHLGDRDFRAAYTTPVKSLSNDKVREFRAMFGQNNVGIATGDIKENLDAPIVVATLESYRNSLLGVEPDLGRRLVVFDEYHFVQDASRGSAWEEAIILSPPSTQILMLSASVNNPLEFCRWIEKIKNKPCKLITVTKRPVPLEHLVYYRGEWVLARELKLPHYDRNDPLMRFPIEHDDLAACLKKIESLKLTPCIIYTGQRLACESIVNRLIKHIAPLPRAKAQEIKDKLDAIDSEFDCYSFLPAQLRKAIIMYGMAYHHSGLGPQGRIAVEALLKDGSLRFCAATMGLSIGINFAVRSAVVSDYRRPGSQGMVQYGPSEIMQMLGRAGRRGQDRLGFSLWATPQAYKKFVPAVREDANSQLRNDPTTFLGLLGRNLNLAQIERFYQNSFLKFQAKQTDLRLLRKEVLVKEINRAINCASPAHCYARLRAKKAAVCQDCQIPGQTYEWIKRNYTGNLASLHFHLHAIGAIDEHEKLSEFGSVARFFPQAGGLLFAEKIVDGDVNLDNLLRGIELMAALTMARFKEPSVPAKYKFPFDADATEHRIEELYPYDLFPEVYDPPFGRRSFPVLREFNPNAAYIVKEWLLGAEYPALIKAVCHEKFAAGDVVNLIYRTATFVQSLAQTRLPELSSAARMQWDQLMRPPLRPRLSLGEPEEIEPDGEVGGISDVGSESSDA